MIHSSSIFFGAAFLGFGLPAPLGRFLRLFAPSGGLLALLALGAGLLLPCAIKIPPIASTTIAAPAIATIGGPPSSSLIQEDCPSSG